MRRSHIMLSTFLTVSFLALPCYVVAAVAAFSFEGTVDGVGLLVLGINPAIGTVVTGTFSYDTTLALSSSGPSFASYQVSAPYSLLANINGSRIESGGFFSVFIENTPGGDVDGLLSISSQPAMVNGMQTADGVFSLSFANHNPNTFANLLLPD